MCTQLFQFNLLITCLDEMVEEAGKVVNEKIEAERKKKQADAKQSWSRLILILIPAHVL